MYIWLIGIMTRVQISIGIISELNQHLLDLYLSGVTDLEVL